MYTSTAHGKSDKPCSGMRYDVFHKESGLSRHQLDMNVFRPSIGHKDADYSRTVQETRAKKGGGHHPCGGRLHQFYQTLKNIRPESDDTTLPKNIESSMPSAGTYSAMNDARFYASSADAAKKDLHGDMNSIDTAINFTFDAKMYTRLESELETLQYLRVYNSRPARQDTSPSVHEKDRYKEYNKEYKTSKYSGRDIRKEREGLKKGAGKKQDIGQMLRKEDAESESVKKIIEKRAEKEAMRQKTAAPAKDKLQKKSKKARKNGIHRRALPSGPEAVRKGRGSGRRKG